MTQKTLTIAIFILAIFISSTIYSQSQQNDNEKITSLIAKKRAYNKNTRFGYRIQLFYGKETKAKRLKANFQIKFPTIKTYIRYEKPYWKIKVGNYKTKLKADRALLQLKGKYSGAIVISKNR